MNTNTATISTDFLVHKEIEGNTFELDKLNKIAKISWLGNVNLSIASELLTLAGDHIEFNGYTKLLVDRTKLTEFNTEARVWIKDLLKTRAKKIARKVDKVALINAKSSMGKIFSNMMATAISLILPNMKMKKFDEISDAERWLLE